MASVSPEAVANHMQALIAHVRLGGELYTRLTPSDYYSRDWLMHQRGLMLWYSYYVWTDPFSVLLGELKRTTIEEQIPRFGDGAPTAMCSPGWVFVGVDGLELRVQHRDQQQCLVQVCGFVAQALVQPQLGHRWLWPGKYDHLRGEATGDP